MHMHLIGCGAVHNFFYFIFSVQHFNENKCPPEKIIITLWDFISKQTLKIKKIILSLKFILLTVIILLINIIYTYKSFKK